jgi:cytochrome b subunit of formate dehydrogenase
MSKKIETQTYERFPVWRRIEHIIMVLSFSTLGLTGIPQKYPSSTAGAAILQALGGIENLRFVHHTAAIVMMFGTAWHILVMGYSVFVMRDKMSMLPSLQDAKDGIQALFYNIGFVKEYPKMGRYTFEEKLEYWAFVWGAAVMGATGFLMWNPITSTRYLPGEFVPAAKAAHGGEAVLAVLAIIIWHIYGVHIKRFNKAMFTGLQTEAEMLHEHPLELDEIKAGSANRRPDRATIRKRQMIYFPIAAFLTLGMLAGIIGFINVEETALTTIEPLTEPQIYVPQTPVP